MRQAARRTQQSSRANSITETTIRYHVTLPRLEAVLRMRIPVPWCVRAAAVLLVLTPAFASAQAIQALGVFEQRCGSCHTKPAPDSRAPDRESLRQRTPEAIL